MKDKRLECGCHIGCTIGPHVCEKPCRWPLCLTPDEEQELIEELRNDAENGLL